MIRGRTSAGAPSRTRVPRGGRWSRSNRRKDDAARRTRFFQFAVLVVGLPTLLWLVFNLLVGERGLLTALRMVDRRDRIERDISAIDARNAALRLEIERLRKDPLTIETLARERLGMGRPGELTYRFEDAAPGAR
jgi:cell division protein FtsB